MCGAAAAAAAVQTTIDSNDEMSKTGTITPPTTIITTMTSKETENDLTNDGGRLMKISPAVTTVSSFSNGTAEEETKKMIIEKEQDKTDEVEDDGSILRGLKKWDKVSNWTVVSVGNNWVTDMGKEAENCSWVSMFDGKLISESIETKSNTSVCHKCLALNNDNNNGKENSITLGGVIFREYLLIADIQLFGISNHLTEAEKRIGWNLSISSDDNPNWANSIVNITATEYGTSVRTIVNDRKTNETKSIFPIIASSLWFYNYNDKNSQLCEIKLIKGTCEVGWFGYGCSNECHCGNEVERFSSDEINGMCLGNGGCLNGWSGIACNESVFISEIKKIESTTDTFVPFSTLASQDDSLVSALSANISDSIITQISDPNKTTLSNPKETKVMLTELTTMENDLTKNINREILMNNSGELPNLIQNSSSHSNEVTRKYTDIVTKNESTNEEFDFTDNPIPRYNFTTVEKKHDSKQTNNSENNNRYKFTFKMFLKNNGTNERLEILDGPKEWVDEEKKGNNSDKTKDKLMNIAMRNESEKKDWLTIDYMKKKPKAGKLCSASITSFQYLWIIQMMIFFYCI